jgi:hypothetical protein
MTPGLLYYLVLPFTLLMIVSSISMAAEGDGGAVGLGSELCSVYMTTYEHNGVPAHDDDNHSEEIHLIEDDAEHYVTSDYITWLQGYLSGYNIHEFAGENIASKASVGGMLNFLYRRCSEHPDDAFYTVLPLLLERMNPDARE